MKNKKTFTFLLSAVLAMPVLAQTAVPCGVYEGADKADGLSRSAYLEINIAEAGVPDFSQTFVKGQEYKFALLPNDFMKKPSQYFKGKKANGFIKYRSKYLLTNNEVCMLSEPKKTSYGWTLAWNSDYGKSGTCELHVVNDSTLYFVGLGTIGKELNSDKLELVRVGEPAAKKPYLDGCCGSGDTAPKTDTGDTAKPASGTVPTPGYTPETDGNGNVKLPTQNSGTLKGRWIGKSGLAVKVNSLQKSYEYYGNRYYGILKMDGPGFIHEGVVRVCQVSKSVYILYSVPLDTDDKRYHWSKVEVMNNGNICFYPTGGLRELDALGRERKEIIFYLLEPFKPQYAGMFTTGSEVSPFPLDFYTKAYYDNGYGSKQEGHGCVTTSFNGGMYIDNDLIKEAKLQDDGSVWVKWTCGRTDNTYTAVLVYDKAKKAYTATRVRNLTGDSDDCYMINASIKLR